MKRIIRCDIHGIQALCFDTGLNARAFAQTKSAHIVTQPGWKVTPDGKVELWKLEGVVEQEGSMLIWGKDFDGEMLSDIISDNNRKEEALDALRCWIKARILLTDKKEVAIPLHPYPIGALIDSQGVILFPPSELIELLFKDEESEKWRLGAVRWLHPDLKEDISATFAAGTMAYCIFSGSAPFNNENIDILRQDLRDGVFTPIKLAVPGIDDRLAELITGAIEPFTKKSSGKKLPTRIDELGMYLGYVKSASVNAYIQPVSEEKRKAITLELDKFKKRQVVSVKTKRFIVRNTTYITLLAIILTFVGILAGTWIESHLNRPTTKGMTPKDVVAAYYSAMGYLDHIFMEASVMNRAGRDDIELVTKMAAVTRIRRAHESNPPMVISAQTWLDSGGAPSLDQIFGVSDLKMEFIGYNDEETEAFFRVSYRFWFPYVDENAANIDFVPQAALPVSWATTDTLRLVFQRNMWRIAEINRDRVS